MGLRILGATAIRITLVGESMVYPDQLLSMCVVHLFSYPCHGSDWRQNAAYLLMGARVHGRAGLCGHQFSVSPLVTYC